MTLKQIAQQAGISISTASRVLNGSSPNAASPQMQARIWQIAQQGGYIPNRQAQELKKTRQNAEPPPKLRSIYCIIACSAEEVRDDPFFPLAISSIEREAFQSGYLLEYNYVPGNSTEEMATHLLQYAVSDYLIIIGRFAQPLYQKLSSRFKKMVYISWNDMHVNCDAVLCDGFQAAQDAVSYLYSLGHRKIALIGAAEEEARSRGYLHALKELGLPCVSNNIAYNPVLSYEAGRRSLEQLLQNGMDATAIYCANDTTAIGVLGCCKSLGIHVPDDLSVIGSNNVETTQYVSPMLTTIHIPLDEMGRFAVRTLVDRINNGHSLPIKVIFPYHIVMRESCRAI